jgi:hypothetical protein
VDSSKRVAVSNFNPWRNEMSVLAVSITSPKLGV